MTNSIFDMKTKIQLCLILITITILCIAAQVYAAAKPVCNNPLTITVEQVFSASSSSVNSKFTYRFEPLGLDSPMPPGSTAEGYTFTADGADTVHIGPIKYSRQDVYRYKLYQIVETQKAGYTYDRRVYTITVYVSADLCVSVVVYNEDGTKAAAIAFVNRYSLGGGNNGGGGTVVPPPATRPSDPKLTVDPPVTETPGIIDTDDPPVTETPGIIDTDDPPDPLGTSKVDDLPDIFITDSIDLPEPADSTETADPLGNADMSGPGGASPKTGDEMNMPLYFALFTSSSLAAVSATAYLFVGRKRKHKKRRSL